MDSNLLNDRRVWLGGGALVALLLIAVSWLMLISPKLDSATSLASQNADAQNSNSAISAKNAKLAAQAKNIDGLRSDLLAALNGLPVDSGLTSFTTELANVAARDGVKLTSIGFAPQASSAAAPATTPATETSDGASNSSTSTGATAESVSVTLSTNGTGAQQSQFLTDLNDGARRVLITSTQLSVTGGSRVNSVDAATTMTTQLTIFSSPMTAAQLKELHADLSAN